VKAGQQNSAYALNLDIAPTLLDWAGIPVPADMQGKSMKKLLQTNKDANWRNEIYYHYYERSFGLTPHYGVKTKRYKLLHFYGPINSWELYDLENDQSEMHNLVNDSRYAAIISQLKERIKYWQDYYKDPVKE